MINSTFNICEILNRNNITKFTAWELQRGLFIPNILIPNIEPTIIFVNQMRLDLGFPMTFTSTYRNEYLNKKAGGVVNSMHLVFNALDVTPVGGKFGQLKDMHEYCHRNRIKGMGIGYYETFIHIDTRGTLGRRSATWNNNIRLKVIMGG